MSAWAVKDKSETWDAVCDRAWAGEPQFVSRGPSQMIVVVSYVDYRPSVPKRRKIVKNPKLAFKISDADLFSDDSIVTPQIASSSQRHYCAISPW